MPSASSPCPVRSCRSARRRRSAPAWRTSADGTSGGLTFGSRCRSRAPWYALRALEQQRKLDSPKGQDCRRLADRRGPPRWCWPWYCCPPSQQRARFGGLAATVSEAAASAWPSHHHAKCGAVRPLALVGRHARRALVARAGESHGLARASSRFAVLPSHSHRARVRARSACRSPSAACFAGVILSESELSHRAGRDSLPLQDAFAVLFFVSVGMLFDPAVILRAPLAVLGVILVVVIRKKIGRGVRDRTRVPTRSAPPHDLGQSRADRRVLLHPDRARHHPAAAAFRKRATLILAGALFSSR